MQDNASDNTQQPQTTQPQGTGEALSSSAASEPQQQPQQARATDGRFEPTEWRYPADYHIGWMANRTAEEVANLSNQMYQNMLQGGTQPAPQAPQPSPYGQPQPQPVQPTQPNTPTAQLPTEQEWIDSPQLAAEKQFRYMQETQLNPLVSQYAQAIGQQARTLVEMREPDAFKRWGPEIDMMVQKLPPQDKTVDNIQLVVQMVRANHADELIQEGVKRELAKAQETGTMRSDGATAPQGGSPSGVAPLDLDAAELPENYRRTLARYNVKPETLDEFLIATECNKRGISLQQARDEWLEKAKKGDIVTEEKLAIG